MIDFPKFLSVTIRDDKRVEQKLTMVSFV